MGWIISRKNVVMLVSVAVAVVFILLSIPLQINAAKKVKERSQPSYGVDYQKIDYTGSNIQGRVDVLEIDVADMFTEVQMGKAEPLNRLTTVRNKATAYHSAGNHIVGAINANFYQVATRRPVHLISEDNRLVYAGYVNDDSNQLINEPIAFGMDEDGQGLIDHYNLDLTYTFDGETKEITHTNRERASNNTILYTSDFYKNDTATDDEGTEVVLKSPNTYPELTLGSTLELEVDAIREEGDKKPTTITDESFVLSGNGKGSTQLEKMDEGDTVQINTDIDEQWQDSAFMLAGGPQLVKNGKVAISMNTASWKANALTSRTAVGVDQARDKVFFVTADTSISDGMSIKELARLMKDLGADAALNLDGGGSTTMVVRPEYEADLQIMNKLQEGTERSVSGILMAADTEPERIFHDVSYRDDLYEGIQWAKNNGSIQGYKDHTFKPYKKLSRKHGAVMFTRAFDLNRPEASDVANQFSDISSSHEYAQEIAAVGQASIFTGGTDNRFSPDGTLTREQMASTIVRAYDWEDHSAKKQVNLQNVDPSHRDSVQILANKGVTKELDDFRPRQAVTRGQFAAFLQRASHHE